MKYLFFDMEYASSKGGVNKVCEFGYVVTDEKYIIIDRDNLIINPNIARNEWDYWAVRKILSRSIKEYEAEEKFLYYYEKIKQLIKSADLVIGHTLSTDAKAINDECKRYKLQSLDYKFYDVKEMYKEYSGKNKSVSVVNILEELDVNDESVAHDAENDAYKTMLGLKKIIENVQLSIQELIELCPSAEDFSKNFQVGSIERSNAERDAYFHKLLFGDNGNDIIDKKSPNYLKLQIFIDNVRINKKGQGLLKDKKICLSSNYEEHHFNQVINLIQIIVNESGQVIQKASDADIFIKYDVVLSDGSRKKDSRLDYVLEAIKSGKSIQVILFTDFLKLLGLNEKTLNEMSPISFDFIYDSDTIIRNPKIRKYIEKAKTQSAKKFVCSQSEQQGITLGELFPDLFRALKEEG